MKIKVSDYIAAFLHAQQIDHVFEMAGGMITQILDAILTLNKTQIISVHHEQAAAFAVDGYGRSRDNVSVALATSGPGATNLLTGVASCYFDSTPAMFITGQVNTHELKGDKRIRQLGFQETDILAMAASVTKKCYQITTADQIEHCFIDAYTTAINGRPGPVLIDLPMNLQRIEIDVSPLQKINRINQSHAMKSEDFSTFLQDIESAKKPLILVGNGVHCAHAEKDFVSLIKRLQIPVVTSLLGVDLLPYDHPLRVGLIGSYGNRWANLAIGQSDLLIVLGSRLDIRQTGADVAFFKNKKIYHVDCDPHEINNRFTHCFPFVMDVKDFIIHLDQLLAEKKPVLKQDWLQEINTLKTAWPDTKELNGITGINPNYFMHLLSQASSKTSGYIADVGNHQMWAAQSLQLASEQFFITSGGMGAMGFALPAAVGASLAQDKKPVVVIAGDGGFQLNIQELQTIVRNELPIKIVVLNNQSLGMIRQFQDTYFDGRYQSTYWGYSAPDFTAIANAYGIASKTIALTNEIESALASMWEHDEAFLLQVMIDIRANAYPKIAFGKPITEMEPFATAVSMEGT